MNTVKHEQSILIVDDMPVNIKILGELLKQDFTIQVATSGEKALQIAQSDPQPDLIILDIVMPMMDGFEVCQKLKSEKLTEKIPVIFITSKSEEHDEVAGFSVGAVDYITKPFNPLVVRARVNMHAELKKYKDFLENSSYTDGLTGLSNRRRFDEYFSTIWNFAARENSTLSLIMMDIDFFKQYNDHYGHLAGDDVLKKVTKQLATVIKRKSDLIARYGGEEFVCILPNTEHEDALRIAELLRQSVLDLKIPHEHSMIHSFLTMSVGVVTQKVNSNLVQQDFLNEADKRLYQSKRNGRNRVTASHLE